ncbi:MAG: hypothetical protein DDT19_00922 [Syntrophomonadaceae bacterium]|nr:hypothetical protein [Bacillota bacterium]
MMRRIQPKIWISVITVCLVGAGLALFFVWPKVGKITVPGVIPEEIGLNRICFF